MNTAMLAMVLVPAFGAGLILSAHRHPNLRETFTLLTAGALFALVAWLAPRVAAGARPGLIIAEPLPGLRLALSLEPLGLLFALVASFLWIVTSVYAIGYMRGHHETHQTRFYCFFALSIAAAMGIATAGNMLTLFVFYELLTLLTYPLVIHSGTAAAQQAGRTYLGLLLATSIPLLLLALVWTHNIAGTLDFSPGGIFPANASPAVLSALLVLYLLGIGKAALMPFHRWLPAAMVAPTPVSALLHAVAVVKAGVFTVLKVVIYVFGLDTVAELAATPWLAYLAAATLVIASLIALTQDNLKSRLAYSTVSQLAYIVLGALTATATGVVGGALHIATHAFGKITLFFCAGAILVATHKSAVSELNGLGRRMPVTFATFLIAAVSIIGLPPGGGLWSKWYLVEASLETEHWIMLGALLLSSLLNIAYLLPIPLRAFFLPPADAETSTGGEAPWACVGAIIVTAAGTVALFLWPQPAAELIRAALTPSP